MAREMAMIHDVARCSACRRVGRVCSVAPKARFLKRRAARSSSTRKNASGGYCRTNYPFNVPRIDSERNKSTKCDLCFDRIEHGMIPSCAKTCTAEAISFGTKAAMIKLAEERLKEVRMNHPNAQLYGVHANGVGGTHMMYVLPEPPEVYGLPKDPKTPDSIDLWCDYIRSIGKIAGVGAAAGLAGLMVLNKLIGNKGA
ncbi:MAG: formate dehydrogenase [Selenomonadaceae bacterium]|nr:formate dehydrogenase [Selenomonadaceae bacterium]